MGSPYRELPSYLLCPRCGETLSRELEGVSSCMRCHGLWLSQVTLDAAFGNPRWPTGQALWWRNSIHCPECVVAGKQTLMTALASNDVMVDQCPEHGIWLDHGELGRLMGTSTDELAALRQRLATVAPDYDQLVERREKWRADLESHRRVSHDYHRSLQDEHRRRQAESEDDPARPSQRPSQRLPVIATPAAQPPPARAELDASEGQREAARYDASRSEATREAGVQLVRRRQELATQRAQAAFDVAALQARLGVLRKHIQRLDAELAATRDRTVAVSRELDTTLARLRDIDGELE